MKHPKWLLVLVLILLFINVLFFSLWYALDVQGKVKAKVEVLLSQYLDGKVKIGKLSFNDRHITANNSSYLSNDSNYSIKISQLQIRYNLLRILFSGFKISKAVQSIEITEPDAVITYKTKPRTKVHKPNRIPDLAPYFRILTVHKGKVRLTLDTKPGKDKKQSLYLREAFSNIELKVSNSKASDLSLQTTTARGGKLEIKATLLKGLVTKAGGQIISYKPAYFRYSMLDSLGSEISVVANYSQPNRNTKPRLSYNVILWNTGISYKTYTALIPYTNVTGDLANTRFEISESSLNKHKLELSGSILNPLDNPFVNVTANIQAADLSELSPALTGIASGKAEISGKPANLSAKADLEVPELTFKNETVTNVNISAAYKNHNLAFKGNQLIWQNQSTDISGDYDLTLKKANVACQSRPVDNSAPMRITTDLSAEVWLGSRLPYGNLSVNQLDFHNPDYAFTGLNGNVTLPQKTPSDTGMPVEVNLSSPEGYALTGKGDILKRDFIAQLSLTDFQPSRQIGFLQTSDIHTMINGTADFSLHNNIISGKTNIATDTKAPIRMAGSLNSAFEYILTERSGKLTLDTKDFTVKDSLFSINLQASIAGNKIDLHNLKINDEITALGWVNLKDWHDARLVVKGDSLSFGKYWEMFDPSPSPLALSVDIDLDYNSRNDHQVSGTIYGRTRIIDELQPLDAAVDLSGTIEKINIDAIVTHGLASVANVTGFIKLNQNMDISLQGNVNKTKLEDIFTLPNTKGTVNGDIAWQLKLADWHLQSHTFSGNITGKKILFSNVAVDTLLLDVAQLDEYLQINNLLLRTNKQITVSGNGKLDFNLLRNSYLGGDHILYLSVDGDALKWLKDSVPYLENAKGYVKCQLSIQAQDDGFHINNGVLSLTHGVIKLKDQVESMTNIELQSKITNDVFTIDKFNFRMGTGRMYIRNAIDPGGDNFNIGSIVLGYLLLRTDENGVDVTIPGYMPKGTVVKIILKGQNKKEASVKGPFDDMKISAETSCSNGSVVYPANSKNLMQLIESFRKSFSKAKEDSYPLPFTLDLLVRIEDNVKYVTYPANFVCMPGSFLRLTYDGNEWDAPEAEFNTEQGTLDFFGTVFNADFIRVAINSKQRVTSINGTLLKRAPDGSTVTLTITTNPRKGEKFWDQLEFTLSSDNPEDKTSTQVLSRLRYNSSVDELTPSQRQNLLQDEALQLVGSSLNTTLFGQVLSPVENRIRRFLRLDSFTISTGFVQNLFMEYGSNTQQKASFSDPNNLNADVMQFSSSVFLNNLSLSMGKYLGRSMFLDYQIQLQESTDLQAKTDLVLYHNTTLRVYLPWKLKLNYTFSIRPEREKNTHEVMLQRSFKF